ncbi:MAG: hypothetical protein K1X83_10505 [Oligoflexia bacterium]|nr:hypothetical protein [Oligoflexia bacterium]
MNSIARGLLALVALEVILDLAPIVSLSWPLLAEVVWLILLVAVILYAIISVSWIFRERLSTGHAAAVFMLLYHLGFICFFLTQPYSASHETANQIACGLERLQDLGSAFQKNCFLGYPARGYALAALPSLLLGRNHFALNFGGALPLLIGYLIFAAGTATHLRARPGGSWILCAALTLPLHFFYITHFTMMYEQSAHPFALGLALVGLGFIYLEFRRELELSLIAVVLLELAYTYTTGLALLGLALVLLGCELLRARAKRLPCWQLGTTLLLVLIDAALTFVFREDVRFLSHEPGTGPAKLIEDLREGFWVLLTGGADVRVMSYISLALLVVLPLAGIFTKRLRALTLLCTLWIIATFGLALCSQGYATYVVQFRLHRAIVICPILMMLLVLCLEPLAPRRAVPITLALLLFMTGVLFQSSYVGEKMAYQFMIHLNTREFSRHLAFIQHVEAQIGLQPEVDHGVVYIAREIHENFASLGDQLHYYLPHVEQRELRVPCPPAADGEITIYAQPEESSCIPAAPLWRRISDFSFLDEPTARVYVAQH